MEQILKIRDRLLECDEITIISHFHPDGDTIGSQLALAIGLEQLGKKTVLINKDTVPQAYRYLCKWEDIKPLKPAKSLTKIVVCVDCATIERTGYELTGYLDEDAILINIDHHISNSCYGNLNWIGSNAAATAELIYDLLGLLQVRIDQRIANPLYVGISTDTGSFLYENTTSTTHVVVADLINRGADINLLRNNYYENISMEKIKLLTFGLNHLTFTEDNKISWITIDLVTFRATGAEDADAEGLINYLKSISGVEIAIIFRELAEKRIKISFRSKKNADVNKLAANFGGGGHPRAAGCIIEGSYLKEVVEMVIGETRKILP
ncbi:MAG: DHH family phosphoesterase [Peptococcaceae bacterium]